MKNIWIILISIVSLILLVGAIFFFIGYFKPKPGGIFVSTNPEASIYVNGAFVGKSPFTAVYQSTAITLKVVPLSTDQTLLPFETKLTLTPGIQTVVRREFAKTDEESSGDILSFEKENGKTSLIVISTPDNSQVSIDGVPRGFAPYKTTTISPAEHQITVKAPGYADRVMTVKTINGYRLTVFAKLGKIQEEPIPSPASSASDSATLKTYIEILNTPTGFLRVRTAPGSSGEEIAEVSPGSKYLFLSDDSATGWYEIQYKEPAAGLPKGITGWVSNQFTKKIEAAGTP